MPIPRRAPAQPRKQPKQGRSSATVEAILEAAARILEQSGFSGFNTNAVAALAGVSPGSLYQYYPDKEALLRDLVMRDVGERAGRAIAAIETHSGQGAVAACVRAALAHAQQRPALTTLLALAEPLVLVETHDRALVAPLSAAIVRAVISDYRVSEHVASDLVVDALGISKGLLLAAAARGSVDAPDFADRVVLAITSYLKASTERL
jgi:AcrR family transcriptional regulator